MRQADRARIKALPYAELCIKDAQARSRAARSVDPQRTRAAQTLFVAAFLAYGLDRITKIWAEATLPGDPIELIPGVLTLRFTTNSGGAFSIGRSAPWFFVAVTAVVVVAILATSFRHTNRFVAASLGWSSGSAREPHGPGLPGPGVRGRVVDFIDLRLARVQPRRHGDRRRRDLLAVIGFRERDEARVQHPRVRVTPTCEAEEGRLDAVVARLSGLPRADVQRAIAAGRVSSTESLDRSRSDSPAANDWTSTSWPRSRWPRAADPDPLRGRASRRGREAAGLVRTRRSAVAAGRS